MKLERRSVVADLRADGRTISGYAAKFNTPSQDLGGFIETIAPGAFDLAASTSVILNYDHDNRAILGRTESGTLKLSQDDVGLRFECELPEQSPSVNVAGLIEAIGRGDLRGCSFAFTIADEEGETWSRGEDGLASRTLLKVVIYDVCVTPCPAYLDTDVAVRRLEQFSTRRPAPASTLASINAAARRLAQQVASALSA
ncbi:MAG: HK97 family phage prohead protease [Planctomycetes bacterium]|nr:HK97 family phage prohead protease [Planctomycetota bacterium]